MIVGTAGHIDHGKTTLVRALTGVDTDRLPEEKKRGISVELGYAFMDAPGGERIGFIDVPGHERLVHTMVAGASGIDYALLLVAADDGPMPQTREHLAVLSLLGIAHGAVVITKIDRAAPGRVAALHDEIAAMLVGTSLAGAPIACVSAQTGAGVAELRALLCAAASGQTAARDQGALAFRLAVDRAFTLAGTGTVATGTIHAGRVRVGDELTLFPVAGGAVTARVRSLHAQNRSVGEAHAGQRCAVALAGVARDVVARGQWLSAPAVRLATARLDLRLTLWPGEAKALRSGAHVQAHIGAAHVSATVALLDVDSLAPGASALAQLVLAAPVGAWHGERVLLRDASASRTLAGGRVLDPFAPTRYRRTLQRLGELAALAQPSVAERLRALLAVAPQGVDLARFAAAQGLDALAPDLVSNSALTHTRQALGATQTEECTQALLHALQAFHERQPDELGPDSARLRRLAAPRLPLALWQALIARVVAAGQVVVQGAVVHLPTHGAQLSEVEMRIAQKVAPALAQARFEGAWARDMARDAKEAEPLVRTTLARLARRGELHQVVKDLYYPPETIAELALLARGVGARHDAVVLAAQFRDVTGLGRKRAIQVLEYFDRIGLTRRVGDEHRLRADSALFDGD